MKVNISKAADMVGKTRATLYRHIEKKGITVEKDADDNPVIDVSELVRVYGNKVNINTHNGQADTALNTQSEKMLQDSPVGISALQKQMEMLETSAKREREIFENQIEHLKETLSKAQDGQNKLTLLLENKEQGGSGEWERTLKALEQRVANQEKAEKEREEREQKLINENKRIKQAYSKQKKALETEQNKGFLQKLFG